MIDFGVYEIDCLPPDDIDDLLMEDLHDVAASGFGYRMPREEVDHAVKDSDAVYIAFCGGTPTAFASVKIVTPELGYLAGSVVRNEHKGNGVHTQLLNRRIGYLRGKVKYVSTRTQNGAIYYKMKEIFPKIYPGAEKINEKILELARLVDKRVGKDLIVKGCYGRKLSAFDFPVKDGLTEVLFNKLNLERGDAYVILATM